MVCELQTFPLRKNQEDKLNFATPKKWANQCLNDKESNVMGLLFNGRNKDLGERSYTNVVKCRRDQKKTFKIQ